MATRRAPASEAASAPSDDEGMTAETAVSVMRSTPQGVQVQSTLDDDEDEATIADRLRSLVAQTPSDRIIVKLYRPNRSSRRMEWCADYAPHDLEERDLELIREQWGAGPYELRVIGSSGILSRIQVNIAEMPVSAAPVASGGPSAELAAILRAMQEQNAAQNAALLAAITNRPDPRAEMMQSLEMMRMMRDAFAPPPAAPALDQVAMIRGIAEAVKSMREVSRELSPEDDGPPDMITMLAKGLDTIRTLSTQQAPTQSFPALPAPEIPASFSPESDPMLLSLRSHLVRLVTMANGNRTPIEGGEYIYQELPEELIPILNHASWFDSCAALYPPVKLQEAWARKAHAHALVLFAEAAKAAGGNAPG